MPSASTTADSAPMDLAEAVVVSAALPPSVIYAAIYQLATLYLTITSTQLSRLPGLSWVGSLTYTASALTISSVWSSPTESTRILKGPQFLSRQGLYHNCHCCCWVSNHHSFKLLQIEPYVALITAVKPVPLEEVGCQDPDEATMFDKPSQEKRVALLISVLVTKCYCRRCWEKLRAISLLHAVAPIAHKYISGINFPEDKYDK